MKQPKNRYYRTASGRSWPPCLAVFKQGRCRQAAKKTLRRRSHFGMPSGCKVDRGPADWQGRLGAMVYGGIEKEQLQINEDTSGSGDPDHSNPEAYPTSRTVRTRADSNEAEAEAEKMMGVPIGQMAYQPLGDLFLASRRAGRRATIVVSWICGMPSAR